MFYIHVYMRSPYKHVVKNDQSVTLGFEKTIVLKPATEKYNMWRKSQNNCKGAFQLITEDLSYSSKE